MAKSWDDTDWAKGDTLESGEWSAHAAEHRAMYDPAIAALVADVNADTVTATNLDAGSLASNLNAAGFDVTGAGTLQAATVDAGDLDAGTLASSLDAAGFNVTGAGTLQAATLDASDLDVATLASSVDAAGFDVTGAGTVGAGTVDADTVHFEPATEPATPTTGCVRWYDSTDDALKIKFDDGSVTTIAEK